MVRKLPFDPQNDALQIQTAKRSFFDEVRAGGVWLANLDICFGFTCRSLVKVAEVFSIHNPPAEILEEVLAKVIGQSTAARDLAEQVKGPFRPLLESAVEFARSKALGRILFEKI